MLGTPRSPKKRFVSFLKRPNDQQLGIYLGDGLIGGSVVLIDNDKTLNVQPEHLPVKVMAVWMYFLLALVGSILFYLGHLDKNGWTMLAIIGLGVIPVLIIGFLCLNERLGIKAYLVFDKPNKKVSLPRTSQTFSQSQIREIIFLDRFIGVNRFWQVAMLTEEPDGWKYIHLFNSGGSESAMEWIGVKNDYQKIANSLGVEARRLKFSKSESKSIKTAANFNSRIECNSTDREA